ncbi:MAG TPA: tyrosine-type recombinase/integrase [Leptospiraceae bacterium]|nr:tyrosine-type recombinase/integrase [Leptospiraceae bacterium]HMY65802.1 tyrosine-type recombinase/integrase [Leptospiraceae bacterium]HNF13899.1 tyrosine-type recombinase/integrase [Leptospiraceae bacterium]HNF26127.1 tyrosine-type recombinase/integrase [Leptospiraceae bacterium]HNI95098.1 tyrosine-type recombinase/integrase [Leptospiraceae bacterium]
MDSNFEVKMEQSGSAETFSSEEKFSPALYLYLLERKMQDRGRSRKTVNSYCHYVNLFLCTVKKRPEDVSEEDLEKFLNEFNSEKKPSPSTYNLALSALLFFFRHLYSRFYYWNRPRPKKSRKAPELLSIQEVEAILNAHDNLKYRALLSMVYYSGLTVGEVVNLKIADFDSDKRLLKIRSQKKERTTYLPESGMNAVEKYLENLGKPMYLFPGRDSIKPVSVRNAEKIFTGALKKAGIPRQVSIHALRHAFAYHRLEEGAELEELQKLLGHKNLQSTKIYAFPERAKREKLKLCV